MIGSFIWYLSQTREKILLPSLKFWLSVSSKGGYDVKEVHDEEDSNCKTGHSTSDDLVRKGEQKDDS